MEFYVLIHISRTTNLQKMTYATQSALLTYNLGIQHYKIYKDTCDWWKEDANENGESCRDVSKNLIVHWPIQWLNFIWIFGLCNELTYF